MAQNFKDALLEGADAAPAAKTPAPETTTEAPAKETPEKSAKPVHISTEDKKTYYGIGLRDYATVIAGLPVYVEAGKPWQGTKFQYDTLKRAKLIQ